MLEKGRIWTGSLSESMEVREKRTKHIDNLKGWPTKIILILQRTNQPNYKASYSEDNNLYESLIIHL
jgi:hypothetical protein